MLNNKVTGSLAKKNGKFHIVLSWREGGKDKKKWESTGLSITGNKRNAETLLKERIAAKENELLLNPCDMMFGDFMKWWLEMVKPNIQASTYDGYYKKIHNHIAPYFDEKGVMLKSISTSDIQQFYMYRLNVHGNSPQTIRRYHANIRKALSYARKANMIISNPAECVELPKTTKHLSNYCGLEDLKKIISAFDGQRMKTPVILAAYYGLRRSEVIGIRWDSIDFEKGCIYIREKATQFFNAKNSSSAIIMSEQMKNEASVRTLPLIEPIRLYLIELKADIEKQQKFFKGSYQYDYCDYVCVDFDGKLIAPDRVTSSFSRTVKKLDLQRQISFHGLRHTCATLLLNNDISIKEIQGFLGHSTYSTTADIYSHLEYKNQLKVGNTMSNILNAG